MKVTVLGNNGPFPGAGGACSSYLIESNGTKILADAGSGSLSNLMKVMDPAELDCIFLTHLHNDHITDISVLFYYLKTLGIENESISKIPLYLPCSPTGQFKMISEWDSFIVHVLNECCEAQFGELTVTAVPMTHSVECYALKFTDKNKILVYSGDTSVNKQLSNFAEGCDLLITDSALLENEITNSSPHMSAAQSAQTALDVGAGKLLLSHLNPRTDSSLYLEEASRIFTNTMVTELMKVYEV